RLGAVDDRGIGRAGPHERVEEATLVDDLGLEDAETLRGQMEDRAPAAAADAEHALPAAREDGLEDISEAEVPKAAVKGHVIPVESARGPHPGPAALSTAERPV